MTATVSRFEARRAACGRSHDGSVHRMVVNHHGNVLVDEELRGE